MASVTANLGISIINFTGTFFFEREPISGISWKVAKVSVINFNQDFEMNIKHIPKKVFITAFITKEQEQSL